MGFSIQKDFSEALRPPKSELTRSVICSMGKNAKNSAINVQVEENII